MNGGTIPVFCFVLFLIVAFSILVFGKKEWETPNSYPVGLVTGDDGIQLENWDGQL